MILIYKILPTVEPWRIYCGFFQANCHHDLGVQRIWSSATHVNWYICYLRLVKPWAHFTNPTNKGNTSIKFVSWISNYIHMSWMSSLIHGQTFNDSLAKSPLKLTSTLMIDYALPFSLDVITYPRPTLNTDSVNLLTCINPNIVGIKTFPG